ncbi:malto-oligosyltrehalose synthase [Peterkaempfera bronchialis]|uniref:Malto-oligosyltrehalose synthase n=1 Tax=Peterkaempfera bronchialis TaxID=2126346 RepID=A0A345STG1_9ACTN|nr:malto-oligosyltrehalose synthase [Peterkaempfera bronchialis]AXI77016.1 malto-oligosyltrehalose synthase [Peterkaempfera bronchialis]
MTAAAPTPEPGRTDPRRPGPTATYRLQLQPGFTLHDATAAVPHLAALGVSHLHLSPLLEAVPGSAHGYDTVDHTRISEQLGGEPALRALADRAHAHSLRLIADTVPNHMALPAPEHLNHPLWHVLREGPDSPYAHWFDIDWTAQPGPADAPHRGRVLLPLLGDRLGAVLDQLTLGKTAVRHQEHGDTAAEPVLRYHDHAFPLRPGTEHLPLPELLDHQWYRLAWWRLARTDLNYRRFFTVNDLIALRAEDPEVFRATHGVLLQLHADGVLDGFRIDHPDGLADPRGYLRRLTEATGGAWTVVEKILTGDEPLPADWPCAGTTGYDALLRIDGVLTDREGVQRITEDTAHILAAPGRASDYRQAARDARREVVRRELAAEIARLGRTAARACTEDPADARQRDHPGWALTEAVAQLVAAHPVYRPYVVPGEPASERDAQSLTTPASDAPLTAPAPASGPDAPLTTPADPAPAPSDREQLTAALATVRDLALGRLGRGPARDDFAARFAQTCAAAAAKGLEDKAFYRWYPLLSLNEVGGDPGHPGTTPEQFHAWCTHIQRHWPTGLAALSTHDTKRSADARARLAVLAEMPDAWAEAHRAWSQAAARHRTGSQPGPAAEYLLWQTLVAAWPIDADRLVAALLKSVREADRQTSWTEPDPAFEAALEHLARAVRDDPALTRPIGAFVESTAPYARSNTLAAALLHLTVPGVPDLYQGSEEPLYTLVDPDNRRPVDLTGMARRLAALDAADPAAAPPADLAAEKLHLTATALRLRRDRPDSFMGGHIPVPADGAAAPHLLAYRRGDDVLVAATRLPYGLHRGGGWSATTLPLPPSPSGSWTDLLTRRTFRPGPLPVAELLSRLPVALLAA